MPGGEQTISKHSSIRLLVYHHLVGYISPLYHHICWSNPAFWTAKIYKQMAMSENRVPVNPLVTHHFSYLKSAFQGRPHAIYVASNLQNAEYIHCC